MGESAGQRELLSQLLDELRAGQPSAREQLLSAISQQLAQHVHRQLAGYPSVRRWEQTGDVLQGVLLRLSRALETIQPRDLRDLFAISSRLIRQELIDLDRHYNGPQGMGAHHATRPDHGGDQPTAAPFEPGSETLEPASLAEWTEFHRQVDRLPVELRETFDLLYYQGLMQPEAAELMGVSLRKLGSLWRQARLALGEYLRPATQ